MSWSSPTSSSRPRGEGGRVISQSASLTYRLVQHFEPITIGVNYDPANLIIEGREAWLMGLQLLGPYLGYLQPRTSRGCPSRAVGAGYSL
jgi:hypothetical protein